MAWSRICEDENKDRYEYPEYFEKQVENTRKLFKDIVEGKQKELEFLRKSDHYYVDTTYMTIPEVLENVVNMLSTKYDFMR